MDANDTTQDGLRIIFYDPDQESNAPSIARRGSDIPIWERLADQLPGPTTQRLKAEDYLKLFPPSLGETALEVAAGLASGLSHDKEQRHTSGLLLLSICATLDISGRVAPEEIDEVIKTLTSSRKPKYLDKLKRGARVANEIIAEWAERGDGNRLQQLDQATQVILQARLSVSQWAVLGEYCTPVKERIILKALPQMKMDNAPPVLIPLLISHLMPKYLTLDEICRCLGYSAELTTSMEGIKYNLNGGTVG